MVEFFRNVYIWFLFVPEMYPDMYHYGMTALLIYVCMAIIQAGISWYYVHKNRDILTNELDYSAKKIRKVYILSVVLLPVTFAFYAKQLYTYLGQLRGRIFTRRRR